MSDQKLYSIYYNEGEDTQLQATSLKELVRKISNNGVVKLREISSGLAQLSYDIEVKLFHGDTCAYFMIDNKVTDKYKKLYIGESGIFYYDTRMYYIDGKTKKLRYVKDHKGVIELPYGCVDMSYAFSQVTFPKNVRFGKTFKAPQLQDTSFMFYEADLTNIKTLNINTSNVTTMCSMFESATFGDTFTFGKLFDTSKVSNMKNMFECTTSTSASGMYKLNVGCNFDTSNVENMYSMFACAKLAEGSTFGSKFNTLNVTDFRSMFECVDLPCTLDVLSFNTSSATYLDRMFANATLNYKSCIFKYDLSNCYTLDHMFSKATFKHEGGLAFKNSHNLEILIGVFTLADLSESPYFILDFDTSNVRYMTGLFRDTKFSKKFYFGSHFTTKNVRFMGCMFCGAKQIPNDFTLGTNFDTSKVLRMYELFRNTKLPHGFNLGDKFSTAKCVDFDGMFWTCEMNEDFSFGDKFTTKNARTCRDMFFMTKALPKNITIDFDFNNLTNLDKYESLDDYLGYPISQYVKDPEKLTNMHYAGLVDKHTEQLIGVRETDYVSKQTNDMTLEQAKAMGIDVDAIESRIPIDNPENKCKYYSVTYKGKSIHGEKASSPSELMDKFVGKGNYVKISNPQEADAVIKLDDAKSSTPPNYYKIRKG